MAEFDDLPNEILIKIFSYLEIIKRQPLVTVCKRWNTIIESMWQSEDRLILHTRSSGVIVWTTVCRNIACGDCSIMAKVLKKYNSNLKKLTIKLHDNEMKWSDQNGMRRFCKEFQTNKQIDTFKIVMRTSDGNESAVKMMKMLLDSIPTESLQYLGIPSLKFDINGKLIKTIGKLLEKTTLKYLHLHEYTSSMIEIINKMDSLESLTLNNCKDISPTSSMLLNITKLPNLIRLVIHDHDAIDDEFLRELGNNGKSLLALSLYFGHRRNITQRGIDAIGNLVNLESFTFVTEQPMNIVFLCNLTNLEKLVVVCGCFKGKFEIEIQHLLLVLPKLRKLKWLMFVNEKVKQILRTKTHMNLLEMKQIYACDMMDAWDRLSHLSLRES